MINKSFLGRGWKFPPEFNNITNQVEMVEDEDDIQDSLRILLSTDPGERIMQPEYGCGLKHLLFENIDESIITLIKHTIDKAILFFEPRIIVEEITLDAEKYYEGIILINIGYLIRTTNNRSNIVFPFYINEGTQIKS